MNSCTNTLFIGKVLFNLHSTESTNYYATQLLLSKSKPTEGTAIIAYYQSKGKGQYGNIWMSEAGKNLTLSIILYPRFLSPDSVFRLNQAVSLGLHDLCSDILPGIVKVKWPNDILHLDGYGHAKKMGGILIENSINTRRVNSSIVGIGLNVNQTRFGSGLPDAVSLASVTGREFHLQEILNKLFTTVEQRYLQLLKGNTASLHEDYLNVLYRYNQKAWYQSGEENFEATIVGISPAGLLQMKTANGFREFAFKKVEFLAG